jgi:hypothetical protein
MINAQNTGMKITNMKMPKSTNGPFRYGKKPREP